MSRPSDDGDAEPVPGADVEPDSREGEQQHGAGMHRTRTREDAADAEPRGPRVEPHREVVLAVEQRVEEVEPGDPQAHGAAEGPRLPRQLPCHRGPRAHGRKAERRAEPEVTEPGHALEVRVDDEHHDGDGPEPAHERVELPHRDEVDAEREDAERGDLQPCEDAGRDLPSRGPGVPRIDLRVDEAIEAHRQRPRADHRERDPRHRLEAGPAVHREQRPDVGEREREDRVLEPDEAREPDGQRSRDRAHAGSFVFDTSTISSICIALSIALAMS